MISDNLLGKLKEETKKDNILQDLYKVIQNGWPINKYKLKRTVQPYFRYCQEFTVYNKLILKDDRILVPLSMRKLIKKHLHSGHMGIVKTKLTARDSVYWPGIDAEIDELVLNCELCQIYRNLQPSENEIKHEIPDTPWAKVGMDLFSMESKDYLIIVDYTTNYFDTSQLLDKKSSTVTIHAKRIFSRYGIPKTVMSDNGPEFTGKAFVNFSKSWDFEHDTSSPNYAESNGLVERTIQTVKKTLKKAFQEDQDPYLALLAIKVSYGPYTSTPPPTLMFQRPIPSLIPSVKSKRKTEVKKLKKREINYENKKLEETSKFKEYNRILHNILHY